MKLCFDLETLIFFKFKHFLKIFWGHRAKTTEWPYAFLYMPVTPFSVLVSNNV